MAQYSIKDLEHLSGIKAHTIRIWEQRYNILNPNRTDTNIRFYDDEDLKTILNISLLNEHGYKISKIAKMSGPQIAEEVVLLSQQKVPQLHQIHVLLIAMIEMDEVRFDKMLTTAILQRGLEKTMLEIVFPFLVQTGILWQAGSINPAHEHFVSNIIRQKLFVAIDGQVPADPETSMRFLLYLPEGELHEIGLLFCNFILRARGKHVMYLGQNLPFLDLGNCVQSYKPHSICTAFTAVFEREHVQQHLNQLANLASEVLVYIGGSQVQNDFLIFPSNMIHISCISQFIEHVDKTA